MNSFAGKNQLTKEFIVSLSQAKKEPAWMLDYRLQAFACFLEKKLPTWGPDLSAIPFDDINYYLNPTDVRTNTWDEVPDTIKSTFDALGIAQAEQQYLAGVGAQFESEVVYKNLKKEWHDQGVIFCDLSTGLAAYEHIVKKYFGTVIPFHDNKFAALNSAVWSGGSFVYVPAGVQVTMPLQAYFRIEAPQMGQFERTLIIAEPGAQVHYVEGCSAPVYRKSSLHSAVVELIALEGARIRYTTIQNWSTNVYNLVTKRGIAYRNAIIEWVDGNFGSSVTMKYPSVILKEPGAQGQIISIAVADKNQHQDAGGKMIHLAPNTKSTIISKSISKHGGRTSYRGLVRVTPQATNVQSRVQCDALMMDDESRSDTYPTMIIAQPDSDIGHEASISYVDDQQLYYLALQGLDATQAKALMVNGFIDVFVKELPMEYAIEINRLISMPMEGSIG